MLTYFKPEHFTNPSGYFSEYYKETYYDGYGYNFYYGNYGYYEYSRPPNVLVSTPFKISEFLYMFFGFILLLAIYVFFLVRGFRKEMQLESRSSQVAK